MDLNGFFEKIKETGFYCYASDEDEEEVIEEFMTVAKILREENKEDFCLSDVFKGLVCLLERVDEDELHFVYYAMKLIMADRAEGYKASKIEGNLKFDVNLSIRGSCVKDLINKGEKLEVDTVTQRGGVNYQIECKIKRL